MMRGVLGLALALAVAVAASGCTRDAAKGATADASASVLRVVSLSPSTTEALFAIGAGQEVVGRSRYCDHPPEVARLPPIGGYVDPSFEAILGLTPSLVTGARGPTGTALKDRLESRGIATFFPPTESFGEIERMMLGLGERTGHAAEARAAVDRVRARVAGVERAVAGAGRVRVLLVFGLEPLSVAGPGSFADEMIRRAGGTNVVTEGGPYPMLGLERVFALDPDVVVNAAIAEAHGGERIGRGTPGWSRLRAVTDGRVAPLSDESVLRPGPRVGDGLAALARAIHPGRPVP